MKALFRGAREGHTDDQGVPEPVVPMHYGGFALEPHYRPIADARERFERAARGHSYRAAPVAPGDAL